MEDEVIKEIMEIYANDDIINMIREMKQNGVPINEILNERNIAYLMSLGLSLRYLEKLVNISRSSLSRYFIKFKQNEANMKLFSEFVMKDMDLKIIAKDKHLCSCNGNNEVDDLVLLLSDLQAGAIVHANGYVNDPVKYINEMFDKLIDKIFEILNSRGISSINNFNIIMLGDMVEGWKIFPKQHTILIREQMKCVIENIMKLINTLLNIEVIHKINVYGAFGNHGRISQQFSTTDNWDQMIYDQLQMIYGMMGKENKKFDKLNMVLDTDERIKIAKIGKWRIAYTHGDQLRSLSDGTLFKFMSNVQTTVGWHDIMLLGHWHNVRWNVFNGIDVIINGCMYESEYSKYQLVKKSDICQILLKLGDNQPIDWVERLNL